MALPLVASARPKPENTQMEKKSIQLDSPATVDGKTLRPGQYEVLIDGNQVKFEHNGQMEAEARGSWKTLKFKAPYDSMTLSANKTLQELQFAGSNEALEIM